MVGEHIQVDSRGNQHFKIVRILHRESGAVYLFVEYDYEPFTDGNQE